MPGRPTQQEQKVLLSEPVDLNEKDYVVIVQCNLAKQRCSGVLCEQGFNQRAGGFADYLPVMNGY